MSRRFNCPMVLKVLPAKVPQSREDWDDPKSIGVSMVATYYPHPKTGRKPELICVDARECDLDSKLSKYNIDILIGYGLQCWDLASLLACKGVVIGCTDMVDLAETVKEGTLLYTDSSGDPLEETGRARKLVDVMNATLNEDYTAACDYLHLTKAWLDGNRKYVASHIARMLRGIYRLFVFADSFGYLLVPSIVAGRVEKLVLNTED